MSTYVIVDIHGCYRTLQQLLVLIGFSPATDMLWLVGDLVNRGPGSLDVLRWARALGDRVVCVLGNHDLHLLGLGLGTISGKKARALHPVLDSPDCHELLDWLRYRPLMHVHHSIGLVHAGLLPQWSLEEASQLSREVEMGLRGPQVKDLLQYLSRRKAPEWDGELTGMTRLGCVLQVLTQIRTCTPSGHLCLEFSGPPDQAPAGCLPWYAIPNRRSATASLFFGHWAALGVYRRAGLTALDAGCAWGGPLAAMRLEDGVVFQVPNLDMPAN
jgi:bis(5'-nucleosyl)-tetraphosphatase (symmetrical)